MSRVSPPAHPAWASCVASRAASNAWSTGPSAGSVRVSVQPVEIGAQAGEGARGRQGAVGGIGRSSRRSTRSTSPPEDHERFAEYEASLRVELGAYLAEHVRREGYSVLARPRVTFETAEELASGTFGIATERESLAAAGPVPTLPVDAIAEAPPIAIPEPYVPEPYVRSRCVPAGEPVQEALPEVLPEPEPALEPEPAAEEPAPSPADPGWRWLRRSGLTLGPGAAPIAPPAPFLPVPTRRHPSRPRGPRPAAGSACCEPVPEPSRRSRPSRSRPRSRSAQRKLPARASLHATDALVVDRRRHLLTGPVRSSDELGVRPAARRRECVEATRRASPSRREHGSRRHRLDQRHARQRPPGARGPPSCRGSHHDRYDDDRVRARAS